MKNTNEIDAGEIAIDLTVNNARVVDVVQVDARIVSS